MRVVVTGATGNVGTSVLRSLARDSAVDSVLGVARRLPSNSLLLGTNEWARADVSQDELVPLFRGADCVVHLAWLIQPSHDLARLWLANVHGSRRVFRAVAEAGVPALVYASSVGAYSAGPKDRGVDESWPARGIRTSYYGRHKGDVELELDVFEREHPEVRVVRLRPGFIFKREAASGQRRLFAGPLLPSPLVRPALIPFVPEHPRLRFQAVHSDDIGEAYRLAIVGEARGAFNVAAEPVLDAQRLARLLDARPLRIGPRAARAFLQTTWHLRLQPADGGWADLAYGTPLLDVTRARSELGWTPAKTSEEALLELLAGIRDSAGIDTPPLTPRKSRLEELATRVGGTEKP
jgi:UDP-glucose 4-epimerase